MRSMRALSLSLAYCLTARAVPGPHRPSRPKWELGLQVFDYFEEPGLGRRPHNHHHHSLQKVPSRPAGRRFAEKPQQSSLPAAGTSSRAAADGPSSKLQTEISSADRRCAVHTDTARLQENVGGEGRGVKRKQISWIPRFPDLWSLRQCLNWKNAER